MSKKSRRRNKKILGALAAGLGAMALMRGRNKGAVSTEGQTPPIGGTDHIPSVNKAWRIKNSLASPKWNKMDTSEVDMNYVAPSTKRYRNPDFGMSSTFSGAMAKKGGRIVKTKGGGKAVRGLGRAFTKNKK